MSDVIAIRGAAEHNLRDIDLDLPKNSLIVFTGVSGSGKSSLAFDTLFAEGQRLYVESLSTYARQFLAQLPRPKVRSIEGLAPAIAINQASRSHNPRSTVATMTEIYDHLRVLFAAIGKPHCPRCGRPIGAQSRESIIESIVSLARSRQVTILAPVVRGRRGQFKELFADLHRQGYARARVDGQVIRLSDPPLLDRYRRHNIEVVIDRLGGKAGGGSDATGHALRTRVAQAVDAGLELGEGSIIVACPGRPDRLFSRQFACPKCRIGFPELTHASFSFNSPHGMCPTCEGLGIAKQFDLDLLIAHPERGLAEGAIPLLGSLRNERKRHIYEGVARHYGFDLHTPLRELTEEQLNVLLYGSGDEVIEYRYVHPRRGWEWRHAAPFEGIIPLLMDRYKRTGSWFIRHEFEKVIVQRQCPDCGGKRLRPESLAVTIGGKNIAQVVELSVAEARDFFAGLQLSDTEALIAEDALKEIRGRLDFLVQVGLGYLTLDRTAPTLAGGEAQRIRLAAQVGSGLVDCLYVLDEPSIGLHHRDQARLLETLKRLRDLDNTVIVVEHDEQTIRSADWVVDFGPGAGREGGRVVAEGTPSQIARCRQSLTGRYLAGKISIPVPARRRQGNGKWLILRGVRHHNLKNIDVAFPLGCFICVTGVSGSGKSSLVSDTLQPALARHLHNAGRTPGEFDAIEGLEHLDKAILIDQSPIGRTPRSNPATYTKVFDHLRALFASLPESRARGYKPGRFSFNVAEGRCQACDGYGAIKLESDFLADVWVQCPQCGGKRFDRETLSIQYKGASIADVLDMDVQDALEHFSNIPTIRRILQTLVDVGLGYIKLGQPATTLSGGEAQRVKLARQLARPASGRCLYVLDEPTTGLHFEDVKQLLKVLHQFVDNGNTVIVVEHHPDIIKTADYVIDLGPEGGEEGGRIVVCGTPEQVAACRDSYTGAMLREVLPAAGRTGKIAAPVGSRRRSSRTRTRYIEVHGAREHNLKSIDVRIPRQVMTVFSGVSGSGKTSLAMDTIYAEGQRRFVESLSPYARQFVSQMPKPKVERLAGLSPGIAIDPRNTVVTPRSTVGTVTQIYDYLRVLYARLGTQYCPVCDVNLGSASVADIVDRIIERFRREQTLILAPVRPSGTEEYEPLLQRLQREGWSRVRVDGQVHRLPLRQPIDRRTHHEVAVVVDRLQPAKGRRARIAEAVEAALAISSSTVIAAPADGGDGEVTFATQLSCPQCGRAYEPLTPRDYSFNHYQGWCPQCEGLGVVKGIDPRLVVPDGRKAIREGAIAALGPIERGSLLERLLAAVAAEAGFSLDQPFDQLTAEQQQMLLHGGLQQIVVDPGLRVRFKGVITALQEAMRHESRLGGLRERADIPCPRCKGGRLDDEARATRFRGLTLPELCNLSLDDCLDFFGSLRLSPAEAQRAVQVPEEISARLRFLCEVGLDYLTLHREAATLSGGEAQRVKLASQLGSGLTGVMYVLDEPTVGIHPADNERMLAALRRLRDLGNTLLVVEHDPQTLRSADHIVDFGPGAGPAGGTIVAQGTYKRITRSRSLTGKYLAGKLAIPVPTQRRPLPAGDNEGWLTLEGVTHHNLKDITVRIPLRVLTCVTGPSGSGKSSLINEVLYPELAWRLHNAALTPGHFRALHGDRQLDRVINIDQSPIGQSPRSNPATYVGVFDLIRRFYALLPEAQVRGYTAGHFSFNRRGGRCEACQGMGAICVSMHFLPDVWVTCEQCQGRRYNPEILEIKYRGKTIADVLELSVGEAKELFANFPRLQHMLQVMCDVGLDYLPLGQSALTLSGGEAQRVKLSRELARPSRGHTLYLLDEPTTGLHPDDINKLLAVLNRLIEAGHTVLIIEHNLDVIKTADYVIDLGPGGGDRGGKVVASGRPEDIAACNRSPLAPYLQAALQASPRAPRKLPADEPAGRLRRPVASAPAAAKAPWQVDGRRWHLTRRPEAGGQRQWETELLQWLVELVRGLQPSPEVDWADPRTVSIRIPGADKPFLRLMTYHQWYLDLRFNTAKGLFDAAEVADELGLRPWFEVEGVHRYTKGPRVRLYTRNPHHDMIVMEVYKQAELDTAAFNRFLRQCWEGYVRLVKAGDEQ